MEATAQLATPEAQTAPVETPVVETAPAPETPKVEENKKGLFDLARREAEFAKKEAARKEELHALQENLRKAQEQLDYFSNARKKYKDNPDEVLEKLGITYDELTNAYLDYYDRKEKEDAIPNVERVRKEVEEQFRKRDEERQYAEQTKAVELFQKEINGFVEGNKENFPHLNALYAPLGDSENPTEFIYNIVEEYYENTGELLDIKSAAEAAEEHFREEWEKLNGVLRKKENTPEAAPTTATPATKVEATPPQTTTAATSNRQQVDYRQFTVKERDTPTSITNKFARPVVNYKYDNGADRRDAISKAVAAMEAASNRQR